MRARRHAEGRRDIGRCALHKLLHVRHPAGFEDRSRRHQHQPFAPRRLHGVIKPRTERARKRQGPAAGDVSHLGCLVRGSTVGEDHVPNERLRWRQAPDRPASVPGYVLIRGWG